MPPTERDSASLLDMLEAGRKVIKYVRGKSYREYESDGLLQDAVDRNVEIIGEAARRISDTFKNEHPEIPWRKIIAQRNVLAHEYEWVRLSEMWEVCSKHVPDLVMRLTPLIPPLPPEPDS